MTQTDDTTVQAEHDPLPLYCRICDRSNGGVESQLIHKRFFHYPHARQVVVFFRQDLPTCDKLSARLDWGIPDAPAHKPVSAKDVRRNDGAHAVSRFVEALRASLAHVVVERN